MFAFIAVIRAFFAQNFAGVSPYLLLVTLGSISFQYLITYIDTKEVENTANGQRIYQEIIQKIHFEIINVEKNSDVKHEALRYLIDARYQQCKSDNDQLKSDLRDAQQNIVNIYRYNGFKNISRERN